MITASSVSAGAPGGVAGIQSDPQQIGSSSGMDPNGVAPQPGAGTNTGLTPEEREKEEAVVRKFWKDYEKGRKFDDNYRKQIALDRRYAAGTSDLSWAVTTNLIGAYIDILVALLYARNPDVSVSPAPQVDEAGTSANPAAAFPKTLQIIVSHLWEKGKLKKAARKATRSVLTTGEGWLKCMMVAEASPNAETYKTELNDMQETQRRLEAQKALLEDPTMSPDEIDAKQAEVAALMVTIQKKIEVAVLKMMVIDHVPSENMQVSNDVAQVSDYLDAGWVANEKFIPEDDATTTFPRLTEEDLKAAKKYYQRGPKEMSSRDIDNVLPQGGITAESAQAFTSSQGADSGGAFLRTVEQWCRNDKHIRTAVEGVKIWAKEPFTAPYPTSRFYPYFYFSFYEVDAERHPQSLAWRLYKLQDEYSSVRSNFRLMRERSIPAILVDATGMDDTEARKLSNAKIQEIIAIRPTNPGKSLGDMFTPKPVAQVDMRMFDPQYILADMERISGVQEALSAAVNGPGNPKTATEANIQQTGTNARTSSDRDNEEEMLTELALATAEQALGCLSIQEAQRIAGPQAFWPAGMDIEDLFTMVDVRIEGGSTGKPRQGADQQAWTQLLPVLQNTIKEINQALALGDIPLAESLTEVIKETMLRLGDTSDPMRFIPKAPPPGSPGSNPTPKPVPAPVSISLRGELDPVTAAMLAKPDLTQNQIADVAQRAMMAQQAQGPGGAPPPGGPPGAPPPGPPQ